MGLKYAKRIDANQPAIVKALRSIPGVTVELDHDDIICGYKGRTYWFEIKVSEKSEVEDSQKKLVAEFTGHYKIVWSLDQILTEIGIIKE